MGTNTGRVQANASGRRVPVSIDLSELDRVAEMCNGRNIIPTAGFTVRDLMARTGKKRSATTDQIRRLEREGSIRSIGYRPGTGGEKVYALITANSPV